MSGSWTEYDGDAYWQWSEIKSWCTAIANANPEWVTIDYVGQSGEGEPLILLTIGHNDGHQDDRPGLWLDGGTHASEWTGVMSAVYTVSQWVQALARGDASDIDFFTHHTAYVMPCISPDGFAATMKGHPFMRSSKRSPPSEGALVGLEAQDLDGDGVVRWMRWKDPAGPFVEDPDLPVFMRPRTLEDDPADAYFVCDEGLFLNWDGHRWIQAKRRFGLDLNRNFPAHWSPFSMFGMDGGRYPLSAPESRAVVDAFARRPRIGAGMTNHTYTGCILTQPYRKDTPLDTPDILLFERLAHQLVKGTDYRVFRTYPEFAYDLKKAVVGVWSDTMSTTFGIPGYTLELWDPCAFAGVTNDKPAEMFLRPDPEKIRTMFKAFAEIDGAVAPWTAFEHPQLGPVELGGLDYMRTVRNPPTALLAQECRRGFSAVNTLRKSLPSVKINVTVTTLADELYRIDACLENVGFLATSGSQHGQTLPGTPAVQARLQMEDATLVSSASEIVLEHLQGWGSIHPGGPHSVYPSLPSQGHRSLASWSVKGRGAFAIEWSGGRGGRGVYRGILPTGSEET
ncbi:MAG: M14 family metallopeptidase [Myxococcota bacterium]|nr:M14 family metallopeptidase [Myxococcota bacterium]